MDEKDNGTSDSKPVLNTAKTRIIILATGVVLIVGFLWLTTGSDEPVGAAPQDPTDSQSPDPTYGDPSHLCDVLDEDKYADVTGQKALLSEHGGQSWGTDSVEMTCTWISRSDDASERYFTLSVTAHQFRGPDEAVRKFDDILNSADSTKDDTTPVDGSWAQGVTATGDSADELHLYVQDDNLDVAIYLKDELPEALNPDDALDLATGFAGDILDDLATRRM